MNEGQYLYTSTLGAVNRTSMMGLRGERSLCREEMTKIFDRMLTQHMNLTKDFLQTQLTLILPKELEDIESRFY